MYTWNILHDVSDKKLRWSFLCAKVWCRNRKKRFLRAGDIHELNQYRNQAFLMQIYTRVREIEVVIATRWKKKICLQWRQSIYQIATNFGAVFCGRLLIAQHRFSPKPCKYLSELLFIFSAISISTDMSGFRWTNTKTPEIQRNIFLFSSWFGIKCFFRLSKR